METIWCILIIKIKRAFPMVVQVYPQMKKEIIMVKS